MSPGRRRQTAAFQRLPERPLVRCLAFFPKRKVYLTFYPPAAYNADGKLTFHFSKKTERG